MRRDRLPVAAIVLRLLAGLCNEVACAALGHQHRLVADPDPFTGMPSLYACDRCKAVHAHHRARR